MIRWLFDSISTFYSQKSQLTGRFLGSKLFFYVTSGYSDKIMLFRQRPLEIKSISNQQLVQYLNTLFFSINTHNIKINLPRFFSPVRSVSASASPFDRILDCLKEEPLLFNAQIFVFTEGIFCLPIILMQQTECSCSSLLYFIAGIPWLYILRHKKDTSAIYDISIKKKTPFKMFSLLRAYFVFLFVPFVFLFVPYTL